ncbi:MAG: MarR family transcriptional regulator, partial [Lachnospiraceae bacterium]|nr:MarR family transcriptional regulator [Lachnospiraceae bacterium]MDE7202889.1 MarR family transcriptional regulator [Lachnospiraceae bacterium]
MIPLNPWEHQNAIKTLYAKCVGAVCEKYQISRMELDILLFLANNPRYDTATDIVEIRYLSKSQVSGAIKLLEERNWIEKIYTGDNRKTAHLKICEGASAVVADGKGAQEEFLAVMLQGFTQEEIGRMRGYTDRVWDNIDGYLRSD